MGDGWGEPAAPAWTGQIIIESGRRKGERLPLPPTDGIFLIGRDPQCHLAFDAQVERAVSRKHLQVEVREDGVFLTDLHSYTGTFVEGAAIEGTRQLGPMTRVQVGQGGPTITVFVSPPLPTQRAPQGEMTAVLRPKQPAGAPRAALGGRLRAQDGPPRPPRGASATRVLRPQAAEPPRAPRPRGPRPLGGAAESTLVFGTEDLNTLRADAGVGPAKAPRTRRRGSPRPGQAGAVSLLKGASPPRPPPLGESASESATLVGVRPVSPPGRGGPEPLGTPPQAGGDWFDEQGAPWHAPEGAPSGRRRERDPEGDKTLRISLQALDAEPRRGPSPRAPSNPTAPRAREHLGPPEDTAALGAWGPGFEEGPRRAQEPREPHPPREVTAARPTGASWELPAAPIPAEPSVAAADPWGGFEESAAGADWGHWDEAEWADADGAEADNGPAETLREIPRGGGWPAVDPAPPPRAASAAAPAPAPLPPAQAPMPPAPAYASPPPPRPRPGRMPAEPTLVEGRLADLQRSSRPLADPGPAVAPVQRVVPVQRAYAPAPEEAVGNDGARAEARRARRRQREAEEEKAAAEGSAQAPAGPGSARQRILLTQAGIHLGAFLGAGALGVVIAVLALGA